MTVYVNIHGQLLDLSAKDAVLAIVPGSWAKMVTPSYRLPMGSGVVKTWEIQRSNGTLIGTGATEESAWRDAWSRMLADEVAKERQP